MKLDIANLDPSAASDRVHLHLSLGNALSARKDFAGAVASYRNAIALEPTHWVARLKLAHVLKLNKDYDSALEILVSLVAEQPDNPLVHKEFGRVFFAIQQWDDALASFQHVLKLKPHDADAHHWLASIEHLRGNTAASQRHFQRTAELNPLVRVPAIRSPASFSILLLFAPGAANTPPDALVRMAEYDSYFLVLLANVGYDVRHLQSLANVVVNLVSDVDQGREILPVARALVERLGLPVVNHPRKIMLTDRESVAARLADIRGCRVPTVRYVARDQLAMPLAADLLHEGSLPILVRVAGAHGGTDFEKVDDLPALTSFLAQHPESNVYLTQYVDYQSADGFFRKYRFIYVADEILPYHLAIGSQWKVHHGTTDMANHPWMQREEAAFLNHPECVFNAEHYSTLRDIQQAIGLEFCGIDCGLDRAGNVVVFEVNASMLVHRENAAFTYKTPHIDRIKSAFDAMLKSMALPVDS